MPDGSGAITLPCPIVPPLKWAGGKRWLVERLAGALDLPYDRLIEPFVGSAATFFRLQPKRAVLTDSNAELINVYRCMRANPIRLYDILSQHAKNHSKVYYYDVRSSEPASNIDRAARLIYLNRTCWNALYRVNQKGKFNVPKGTKENVLLSTDNFEAVSVVLSGVDLRTCDFSQSIKDAVSGDLIFADPPYFSTSVSGTFVKYTNPTFTWADQERLARALVRAARRGAHFILTNVDVPELAALYSQYGHLIRVSRQSVISGKALGRGTTSELIWTSFPFSL